MEKLPELTIQEWQDLHKALTVHALYKGLGLSWRGIPRGKSEFFPGGQSPEDIASDAIVRVINGDRTCTAKTFKELLRLLKGVVDSIISHAVRTLENRSTTDRTPIAGNGDGSLRTPTRPASTDPANTVFNDDEAAKLRADIRKKVEPDKLAAGVFECLEAEVTSPSEMALLLDVPITEVHNAQKRLRAAVMTVLRQQGKVLHGRAGSVR